MRLQRVEEADSILLEAHGILDEALGANHDRTIETAEALIDLFESDGRSEVAARWRAKLPTTQDTLATPVPQSQNQ